MTFLNILKHFTVALQQICSNGFELFIFKAHDYHFVDKMKICRVSTWSISNKNMKLGPHRILAKWNLHNPANWDTPVKQPN